MTSIRFMIVLNTVQFNLGFTIDNSMTAQKKPYYVYVYLFNKKRTEFQSFFITKFNCVSPL
jgi:hypothetical protein